MFSWRPWEGVWCLYFFCTRPIISLAAWLSQQITKESCFKNAKEKKQYWGGKTSTPCTWYHSITGTAPGTVTSLHVLYSQCGCHATRCYLWTIGQYAFYWVSHAGVMCLLLTFYPHVQERNLGVMEECPCTFNIKSWIIYLWIFFRHGLHFVCWFVGLTSKLCCFTYRVHHQLSHCYP